MVVLVPSIDPYDQPVERCAKWTMRKVDGLGAWKWVKEGVYDQDLIPESQQFGLLPRTALDKATYELKLRSDSWSFDETKYLVELCEECELRFLVVSDRYKYPATKRSLLDIKARYYDVIDRLNKHSTQSFDKEAERKRMLAEESFEARTNEQIEEEQQLTRIVEEVQNNLSMLLKKRQEMIATVAGDTFLMNSLALPDILGIAERIEDAPESVPSSHVSSSSNVTPSSKRKDKKRIKRAVSSEVASEKQSKKQAVTPILRTSALKPIKAGLARQVDKALMELGLPVRPVYPSERNCELYDKIRAGLADLIEQKKAYK
jgi:hypothetical protein